MEFKKAPKAIEILPNKFSRKSVKSQYILSLYLGQVLVLMDL